MNRTCASIAFVAAVAAMLVTSGCNRLLGIEEVTGGAGAADASPDAPAADAAIDATVECVTVDPAPMSWWDGEIISGQAIDLLDLNTGTARNVQVGPGVVGDGFVFDGNESAIELPFGSGRLSPEFTFEAWVMPRRAEVGIDSGIVSNDSETAGGFIFSVGASPAGEEVGCAMTDTSGNRFQVTAATTLDNFHHYACVVSATELQLFQDGALIESVVAGGQVNDSGLPFEIGHNPFDADGLRFFVGTVDELSFYEAVLDAAMIQQIFLAGAAGKCKP